MTRRRSLLPLLLAAVLVLGPARAPARAEAVERCQRATLRATGELALKQLRCAAAAARRGVATDAACLARAAEHFRDALARADARGHCGADGAAGLLVATVAAFVDEAVAALDPAAEADRCAAAKLAATGRQAFARLVCARRALETAGADEARCLARADAALAKTFRNAERRHTCRTDGDGAAMQVALGTFVAAVAADFLPSAAPAALQATIAGADVHLTWIAPHPASGHTHVRVLRRLNAPPVDAADPAAVAVFFGSGGAATDAVAALLPDTTTTARTYHYAAFGCTAAGVCEVSGSRTTLTPTLVEALRAGGYVLHWRHAAADVCLDRLALGTAAMTMVPDWWRSCDTDCPSVGTGTATARQLNDTGRMEATAIGDAFATLGIPVGRVVSSEFCRNFTTAALMDFGPTVELSPLITFFVHDEASRCASSMALLAQAPPAGANTALIGHAGFSCPTLGALAWSEAAIYKPGGAGGTELVARVRWFEWPVPP